MSDMTRWLIQIQPVAEKFLDVSSAPLPFEEGGGLTTFLRRS